MNWDWRAVMVVCIITLLVTGCGYGSGSIEIVESTSISDAATESTESTEITREDAAEAVSRRVNNIDFSVREHPIDADRYDAQTDRIYKAAFLKAVTNQIPMYDSDKKESLYYRDLLQEAEGMDEAELFNYIKQSDYYYQDFDGDGLPELTVNTEGPCVLKYNPEKDTVELYYKKERGWNLLGTGQMYYKSYSSGDSGKTSKIWRVYAYESVNRGQAEQSVTLRHIMSSYRSSGWWDDTYRVSVDEYREIEVDNEAWWKAIAGYVQAEGLAPHPMSFSALFGDDKSEPKPRYLLEELEPLPMNEESGEEWQLYKRMMEGDFSLVEDERWTSLQYYYELSLEEGDGRCDWDYFLMDFNQDGRSELCIRFDREGVNNTAFFRYEDGKIKEWGNYNSADSHGYEIPLRNGKMMSVSWYQDDKTQWIKRLNSEFYYISERCYDLKTVEEQPSYTFQDYYHDGELCGAAIPLSEEEWMQIEDMIEGLLIPETAWRSCSVFRPASKRPEIPGEG